MSIMYNILTDDVVEINYVVTDFCLLDLSIPDRGVLKPPTMIVGTSISPCSVSFCLT